MDWIVQYPRFLLGLWFSVCICIYTFFFRHPIGYVFFVWSAIGAVYFGADMKLLETGIQTSHFGIKRLIKWKDIERFGYTSFGTRVFYRNRPLVIRLLFPISNRIEITKWCNNYEEAVALIKSNAADKLIAPLD
jgi:hypothetical protein